MMGETRMLAATALVVGAIGAGAAPAAAQGLGLAEAKWYGKAFGGATFPQTDDTTLNGPGIDDLDFELDYDTGYTLGAAFGAYFTPNIAMELEYAYRRADFKGGDFDDGHTSSNAVMLNALYKLNGMGPNGAFAPYFGGGLGWANVDVATDDLGDFKRDNTLAYQLIGGVAYDVTPNWSLNGEVRWFSTDNGAADGDDGLEFDAEFQTFDLLVGATYSF